MGVTALTCKVQSSAKLSRVFSGSLVLRLGDNCRGNDALQILGECSYLGVFIAREIDGPCQQKFALSILSLNKER